MRLLHYWTLKTAKSLKSFYKQKLFDISGGNTTEQFIVPSVVTVCYLILSSLKYFGNYSVLKFEDYPNLKPLHKPEDKIVEAFFVNFFNIIGTVAVYVYFKFDELKYASEEEEIGNYQIFINFCIVYVLVIWLTKYANLMAVRIKLQLGVRKSKVNLNLKFWFLWKYCCFWTREGTNLFYFNDFWGFHYFKTS